jgi:hypothetical protein
VRACGECSACCTVMGVDFDKYYKPPADRCKHQRKEGGCKIYKKRPESCRGFECTWLTVEQMPDFTRPDKLGVMFVHGEEPKHWSPLHQKLVIARPVNSVEAMWSDAAKRCYHMLWHGGLAVWFDLPGKRNYLVDEQGRELPPHELQYYEKMIEQI